jgi:hypothetical protein
VTRPPAAPPTATPQNVDVDVDDHRGGQRRGGDDEDPVAADALAPESGGRGEGFSRMRRRLPTPVRRAGSIGACVAALSWSAHAGPAETAATLLAAQTADSTTTTTTTTTTETPTDASSTTATATRTDRNVGSVQRFAEAIAAALQERAITEGVRGGLHFVLEAARGVDESKARLTLLPRVKKALSTRGGADGPLAGSEGPLQARLALSEEAGTLWAVVVVDGPGLDAPTTVVASTPLDRELSAALGATSRLAQGRFLLERGGSVPTTPGCPTLDIALVDVDGDPALELAVLTRCGIEVVHVDDAARLERIAGPFALPPRRWPRVALGWLAPVGAPPNRVWVATSAGHALVVDTRSGQTTDAPPDEVPLRGASTREGPLAMRWRFGSPVLSLPLTVGGRTELVAPGLPSRVRDLALVGSGDAWVFVAEDGTLAARNAEGELSPLAPERVGDRLLVVDLDLDGEPEIVTTAATSPGEPDQLVVRRPAPDWSSSTVVLKSPLGGGSVVGVAAGHVDFDARIDIVAIEESADGATQTLWRLRHVP